MTFDEFVEELIDATQRQAAFDRFDSHALQHATLDDLELDSLEIVVVGSVLLDHLPRGVDIPHVIEQSFASVTIGELYHLYAAAADRT